MHGLFRRLHADQAKPHRSEAFRRACVRNGIGPDVRRPGPAHLGGHIERLIGTMIGKLRLLPGATGSNVAARDGYDAEADAAMTLVEFERWLLCQIAIYRSEEHTSELQSLMRISYAVFCLKKKKQIQKTQTQR